MRAAFGADMSERNTVIQVEWRTDSDGDFSDSRFGTVRKTSHRQCAGFNLQHRNVGLRIYPAYHGRQSPPIFKTHLDALGVLHDMAVGEDVSILTDNNP